MKPQNMYWVKKISVTIVCLLLFKLSNNAQQYISFTTNQNPDTFQPVRIVTENTHSIDVYYQFPGAEFVKHNTANQDYYRINIEGFNTLQSKGKPALPFHNDIFSIPQGAELEVEIVSSEFKELNGFSVPPSAGIEKNNESIGKITYDTAVYSKNEFFPNNTIQLLDVQKFQGNALALITVMPISFNPVKNKLRVYSTIHYRIKFSKNIQNKTDNNISALSQNSVNILRNVSANNVNTNTPISNSLNTSIYSENYDYLVITHQEFNNPAEKLATWKKQLGYHVKVISSNSWTSNQVNDSITKYYKQQKIKPGYFVIIGDHNGQYAVPGITKWDVFNEEQFTTDFPYACMDGENDMIPDMAHGRISVSTVAEAEMVIDKTINYEQKPSTDKAFYKSATLCSYFQDDDNDGYADRRFCQTSEEVNDYLIAAQGYETERIYNTNSNNPLFYNNGAYSNGVPINPALLISNGFNWHKGPNNIIDKINDGSFFLYHRGHGFTSGNGWSKPGFTVNNIEKLNNSNKLPVVFSINCYSGKFLNDVCFAEKMQRHKNGGSAAVFAASNYSLSGYNDALVAGMIDAIWPNPGITPAFASSNSKYASDIRKTSTLTLGDVLNQGLIKMMENWSGNSKYYKYQSEIYHFFGDPGMKIWTQAPEPINATYAESVNIGANGISIYCNNTITPLATVICRNELIGKANIINGKAFISFNRPLTINDSNLVLTVSGVNHLPIIDTIKITNYENVTKTMTVDTCIFESLYNDLLIGGASKQEIVQLKIITSNNGTPIKLKYINIELLGYNWNTAIKSATVKINQHNLSEASITPQGLVLNNSFELQPGENIISLLYTIDESALPGSNITTRVVSIETTDTTIFFNKGNEFKHYIVNQAYSGNKLHPGNNTNFEIYPNPTTNKLNIRMPNLVHIESVALYTQQGQMVYNAFDQQSDNNLQLNLPQLNHGIYIVRITHNRGTSSQKIIIGH